MIFRRNNKTVEKNPSVFAEEKCFDCGDFGKTVVYDSVFLRRKIHICLDCKAE